MNAKEIKRAIEMLDPYTERMETPAVDSGGQCLTAHWLGGGQKLFWSLRQVEEWLQDKRGGQRA